MKNVMRVLARANGWELVQDLNSVLWLNHDGKQFDVENPFQGLRRVTDDTTRKLMASQIFGGQ
jgi:hypothetical protein